jgi:hypothetical protein
MTRNTFDGIETIESVDLARVTGGKSNEDLAAEVLNSRGMGNQDAARLVSDCRSQFPNELARGDKRLEQLMFSQDGLTAKQTNCIGRAVRSRE